MKPSKLNTEILNCVGDFVMPNEILIFNGKLFWEANYFVKRISF